MRRILTGLLMLALVAGCASRQPAATPPAQAKPPAPMPVPSTTPPKSTGRGPIGKLSVANVAFIAVAATHPETASALVSPSTDGDAVAALVDALNTVESGRPEAVLPSPRFTVSIKWNQPNWDDVVLVLDRKSDKLVLGREGQLLAIDSPAVRKAVSALELLLQPLPKPGTRGWTVDLNARQPYEAIFYDHNPVVPAAFSPDGRYWLLLQRVGGDKGDFSAVPHLLDRKTNAAHYQAGVRTEIREPVTWSGSGFFINWPAHLDVALKEDPMPALRKALGVEPNVRNVIHSSFTPDGKRFAALVGQPGRAEPVDLVLGNADGSGLTAVPAAIRGTATQSGVVARVELSPDGEWLAIAGNGPAAIVRVADVSVRERWTQLQAVSGWIPITWSPDSRYVALADRIYDGSGKAVLEKVQGDTVMWRPDSKALVIHNNAQVQMLGLDGTTTDVDVPDGSVPAGFLPDGRLLVFRTVYPGQQ